jgi:hypothetical protein
MNNIINYSNNFVSERNSFTEKKIIFCFIVEDNELNELLLTTAHLQEESERLENEARKLINENIQIQIEARLLKDKYRSRKRFSFLIRKNRWNFRQLKYQIKYQRKSFAKFERRLREKYEQPLHRIVSNTRKNQRCRRIRSMPSESVD